MGFPFDEASWNEVSGPIFVGAGSSMPGVFTVLAIVVCIVALAMGQRAEAKKYSNHK